MSISLKNYKGEIPNLEPHMLPEASARLAINCDFSGQALRPLADGALLGAMANNPVRGLYTEDGLLFYTWAAETLAWRSPVVNDPYARVYFLTPSEGIFRVATKTGMATNGPSPAQSWRVGVPRPLSAPALRTIERSSLVDYPSASISAKCWWSYNGTRYSATDLTLTAVNAWREYTFSAPAYPSSPPPGVPQLEVELRIVDDANSGALIAQGSFSTASNGRSSSLPGGIEFNLTVDSAGLARIRLYWGASSTAAYTYTYENTWGEESAPAPPAVINLTYLQSAEITTTTESFTGYRPYSKTKIYRTYGTGSTYIETSVTGTGPYVDSSVRANSTGIALLTTDWFPLPDGLQGGCQAPGEWFAFFKDNTLYLTAPGQPHATPYDVAFPLNIRGVLPVQGGLLVTCADGAYFCAGSTPEQVVRAPQKLDLPQAGIAQRSMTVIDGAAAFVTNDGLPLVTGSVATLEMSQKLFTRKSWRERYGSIVNDASIRLGYFDGAIIATSHTQSKGFVLRLDDGVGNMCQIARRIDALFQVPVNDALYYSVGANVYRWAAGLPLAFDWWSRDWVYAREVSLGAGYIRCTGAVTLQVYCDDLMLLEQSMTTGWFRLPPRRGRRWSVRLSGTGEVRELKIARTMSELRSVG